MDRGVRSRAQGGPRAGWRPQHPPAEAGLHAGLGLAVEEEEIAGSVNLWRVYVASNPAQPVNVPIDEEFLELLDERDPKTWAALIVYVENHAKRQAA